MKKGRVNMLCYLKSTYIFMGILYLLIECEVAPARGAKHICPVAVTRRDFAMLYASCNSSRVGTTCYVALPQRSQINLRRLVCASTDSLVLDYQLCISSGNVVNPIREV